MKKRILIVSLLFPPMGGGGVLRIKSIVERLKRKFDITVISISEGIYNYIYKESSIKNISVVRFPSYFRKILLKEKSTVLRGGKKNNISFYIKRWIRYGILFPDEYIFWVLKVFFNLKIIEGKYDIVFSTSPPYSNLLLSSIISFRKNIPLIVEYRDIWHNNEVYSVMFPSSIIKDLFEKWVLKKAGYVVFTTEKQKDVMVNKYPFVKSKSVVIYNGYDEKLIDDESRYSSFARGERDYMKIVYLGSLTPHRDICPFLKAVRELIDEEGLRLKVEFTGYFHPKHKECIEKYNLENIVNILPSVPYKESVKKLKDGDVFLLIQSIREGGDTAIPGKLFEYMATGKPIIIVDDGGAVREFVEKYGYNVCGFDSECIKRMIKEVYFNYKIEKVKNVYTREYMAEKIGVLWEKL